MAHRSLIEYLDHFAQYGRECAYVTRRDYRNIRWSYAEVLNFARRFACELGHRGISKGERVLLWGENSAEWVAVFWGCVLRGVVVVPLDEVGSVDFAARVAQQVEAKLLVCSRKHSWPELGLPSLTIEDLPQRLSHGHRDPPAEQNPYLQASDILEIVFTSGTTAEPKGVVITHGNVLSNLEPLEEEMRKYLKWERLVHPLRFLNLLPLSHVFGQFLGIFLPQLLAARVVFQASLSPAEILRTIRREKVSVLVAVPRILQSLKEKLERDLQEREALEEFRRRMRASEGAHFLRRWCIFRDVHRQLGWRFWGLISGGAALDAITEGFWRRLGYAVVQGYGLTETTSLISVNHPFRLGKGSVGKVLPGREVKLDAGGEILVRGRAVASAYWSGKELKPVAADQGWYRTGDMGDFDEEGHLYFKGRKKEVMVTSAGMNIYPEDLEATLRRQPAVKDCLVIALEHEGNAEPCAVLLLRNPADPAAIVARANQSLAEYQRMHRWFIWPEQDFPRTSTHKPKAALIKKTIEESLSTKAASASTTALGQVIASITGRSPGGLSSDANLESDLNLSSFDRVELMSALEDRYQVDLSETSFASVRKVGDLEKVLRGETPARKGYHYPRWALSLPINWLRLLAHYRLLRPAVLLLGCPSIYGREHLHDVERPVLVISNHIADIDVGFVLTALPRRLRHHLATAAGGEAMETLRTPPRSRGLLRRAYDRVKWILGAALLNLFPLPREAGFRQSFEYAGEAVDRGYNVLLFPEGRHTATGQLLPFRAGIGILVKRLKIPVVPMRIDGLFAVKQAGGKIARPGQISVRIGAPIRFDADSDPAEITRQLEERVQGL